MNKGQEQFRSSVLAWYKKNGRDLPWRHTRDPYKILVSEIMLQQTQVDRVIEKYHSFLKRFPTVQKLAHAKTSSVITEWKGLGYNRRALFLQKTAQAVTKHHKGIFPNDLEALKSLPGIGDYTARAVLSFAFEEKVPMMDTNHRKFYARVLCGGKEEKDTVLLAEAEAFIKGLSKKQVHHWNQAIMDLMSAVARKERDRFVDEFDNMYPYQETKKQKKKSIPFQQTDRYVRGQIIDLLRESGHLSLARVQSHFPNCSDERFAKIVANLAKDGLITQKKKSILLP